MPKKMFTPEQIVGKLRQIEVLVGQGKTVPLACKEASVTAQTFLSLAQGVRWTTDRAGQEAEGSAARERPATASYCGSDSGKTGPEGHCTGKLLSPGRAASPSSTLGTRDSVNGMPAGW